jgi:hypothetical protein
MIAPQVNHGGDSMKRSLLLVLALAGLMLVGNQFLAIADHHHSGGNPFTPETIPWGPAPPFLRPGAQLGVLEGDPTASTGDFTVRLKMPDGYRISPHWHPFRENVTVIAGTLKLGMGDQFDTKKMLGLPAGSFGFLDPDMHHYAMACGETIVQVHGQSPFQFNYVNPNDDPSQKK